MSRRPLLAGLALAFALTGCGTTVDPALSKAAPGSDASRVSAKIPTDDVVSAVRTDPALTAQLPPAVRRTRQLRIGTLLAPGTASLPHQGQVGGRDIGLDVDLRNAVAAELGITWRVGTGTFDTIIPGVQNGKYDVGQANFGVTADREKVVDFATYLEDGQAFLGAKDVRLTKVDDLTDLCGLSVAAAPGTTYQQILTASAAKCAAAGEKPYTVSYFATSAPIFLGLQNGKIDVYFGPTLTLKYDAEHVPGTRFLGQVSSTPVGFVTAKGSGLAAPLAAAVDALIADGTYARILTKWGVADTGVARAQVNPEPTL